MATRKGDEYEREICERLSLWWSEGRRDDIFWRSSGSGARATTRAKAGKETTGSYGDVAAIDPEGAKLLDMVTIEIKRGYPKVTPFDVLDASTQYVQQPWEKFVDQVIGDYELAGSYSWLLITKRDRRLAWVWCPAHLIAELRMFGAFPKRPRPYLLMDFRPHDKSTTETRKRHIFGTTLDNFLGGVMPDQFHKLAETV